MATYNDLYFRTNLQANGTVPQPLPASASPDIIPYGTLPVADPTTFFSGNYNQDVGKDVLLNEQNFIYARMMNLSGAAADGSVSLYYSPASLLLWPSVWMTNQLKTSDGSTSVPVSAASQGIAVTNNPFTWTPSAPNPGDHYCLISQVITSAHPNILPPNPPLTSMDQLANFVCSNPQIGWRNVQTITDPNAPLWQQTVNYTQGATTCQVYIFLQCTGVTPGMSVGFECATPGPTPMISMPPTVITTNQTQTLGIYTTVPANFSSNITYSLYTNGYKDQGGSITLQAIYVASQGDLSYRHGLPWKSFGVSAELEAKIGPTLGVPVGSNSMVSINATNPV